VFLEIANIHNCIIQLIIGKSNTWKNY